MTHLLAIACREIEERAFVLVAAIAIALVSLVVLVIPHGTFAERRGGVVILGTFLGVSFTWALAVILGATLVGRELSDKRLSFYFTRPVSASAIWFGKLIAAVVLLAVSFAIVHAIPLGFEVHEWRTMSTMTRPFAVAAILTIAIVLMLGSHVVSTCVRSRSPILALDFAALLLAVGFFIATTEPLALAFAVPPASNVAGSYIAAFLIASIVGGAWQLSRGRIDARRNHRELSKFVWSMVAVAALTMFAYSRWVLAAKPADYTTVAGAQRGNIVWLHGTARGFYPEFLMNTATGAFVPAGRSHFESGDVVAVVAPSETLQNAKLAFEGGFQRPSDWTLTITRLARTPERIAAFPLSGRIETAGVSSDGSRAAVVADQILTVYDTRSGHALASSRVGWVSSASQIEFVTPDVARTFIADEPTHTLTVRDFDVRTHQWTAVAGPIRLMNPFLYRVAGNRLLTRGSGEVELRDLRDPKVLQTFPVGRDDGIWIMRDGRQAIYHYGRPSSVEIRRDGVRQRVVGFGPEVESVRVVDEIGDHRLLIVTHSPSRNEGYDTTTYILDANTGVLSNAMPHVLAAAAWPGSIGIADDAADRALLHRETGKIDVIDLRTGAIGHPSS
ncbi:MAG TPA: hypothetical protein VGR95_04500 [Thermoanaerobaculia bacterium]|jgi:ABC-type transport system involved in multi-copper enzyme maturation permease subunit|nr:hypothetical protein [Thermoanaerobaculia bacterium]